MTTKPDIVKTYPSLIKGIHPDVELIPAPTDEEFNDICTSVRDNGIQNPIHVDSDGLLLDGRTRLQAAAINNLPDGLIPISITDPDDTVAFVLAQNLHRRHLSSTQRASVISRINSQPRIEINSQPRIDRRGGDHKSAQFRSNPTDKELGKMYNVAPQTISKARYVQEWAPKEAKQVEAGTISLSAAYRIAQRNEELAKGRLYEKTLPPRPKEIPLLHNFMSRLTRKLVEELCDDRSPTIQKLNELILVREDMGPGLTIELGMLVSALKGAAVKLASYAKRLELPSGRVKEQPKQAVKSLHNNNTQ